MFRTKIKFSLYFPEVFELSFHLLKFQNISHLLGKEGQFKVKLEAFLMFGLDVGFLNSLPWEARSFIFDLIKAFILNT